MSNILVVDDQASMRFIISNMLKEAGHTVTEAEDGSQALNVLKKTAFDLVLADVNMPQLNGLEFLSSVRKEWPSLKVVFITSMIEETIVLGAEKLNLDGLILKPFEKAAAMDIINKVLNR